jgi:hypothetical protein
MFPLKSKNLNMISAITNEVIKLAKEVIDFVLHWQALEYRLQKRRRYHYTNLWKF